MIRTPSIGALVPASQPLLRVPPDFLRLPCPVREAGGGSEGESGRQAAGHHGGGAEIRWPRVIINMGPPCSTSLQRGLCPVLCERGCEGLWGKGFEGTSVPLLPVCRRTLGIRLPDLLLYEPTTTKAAQINVTYTGLHIHKMHCCYHLNG